MHRLIFVLFLFALTGCDRVKSYIPNIPKVIQEDPEVKEKREAAEREINLVKLRAADKLVEKWAGQLQGDSFHHEGLTDQDPWGNMIRIDYTQNGIYETASIRSSGPDETFLTSDDLVRTRTITNVWGLSQGLGSLAYVIGIYLACIPVSLLLTKVFRERRSRLGKSRSGFHPILTAMFAPFVVLIYGIMGIIIVLGGIIGADSDGIDMPDFDLFD